MRIIILYVCCTWQSCTVVGHASFRTYTMCLQQNFNLNATWLVYSAFTLNDVSNNNNNYVHRHCRHSIVYSIFGIKVTSSLRFYHFHSGILISAIFSLLLVLLYFLFCFVLLVFLRSFLSHRLYLLFNGIVLIEFRNTLYKLQCIYTLKSMWVCVCALAYSHCFCPFQLYKWIPFWKVCNWQKKWDRVKVSKKNEIADIESNKTKCE